VETGISTIIIRAFRDQDYAGIVELSNAVYADYPWSEAEFRHWDERYDGQRVKLERIVADDSSGRMLGWAEYHHDPSGYHPQKLFIDITVHPDQQNRGTAAASTPNCWRAWRRWTPSPSGRTPGRPSTAPSASWSAAGLRRSAGPGSRG